MAEDDDIDRLLRNSGTLWRSKPIRMPTLHGDMFRDIRPRPALLQRSWWQSAAIALVLVAVLAVVALRTLLPGGETSFVGAPGPTSQVVSPAPMTFEPAPTTTPVGPPSTHSPTAPPRATPTRGPLPPVVASGDSVVAYGYVLEDEEQGGLLCERVVARSGTAPPKCLFEVLVPVTGVDVRQLGFEAGGTWYTDYMRLDGRWTGGSLAVDLATRLKAPSLTDMLPGKFDIPCEAPLDGWSENASGAEGEAAARALATAVDGDPDTYVGFWTARVSDSDDTIVNVVGTVSDLAQAMTELSSVYPYNLCVTASDHSRRQLDEVVESVTALGQSWTVYLEPSLGRVVVWLPVFDAAANQALRPFESMIYIRPVVSAASD